MQIWEFTDYRPYLLERLGPEGRRSGERKALAEAVGIHTTYVSQVLKGKTDFSPEQAESINEHFAHTEDEGEYFLLLVMKDRAGSVKLRRRFEHRIRAMRDERLNIGKRLSADAAISEKDREKFYSTAAYGALHVLTSIPGFQDADALAAALRLPKAQVAEMAEFLTRIGVLKNEGGRLAPGPRHVHLGNETEMVLRHHANWRMHALQKLQFLDREDLHYSAALSISQAGAFRVKENVLRTLKETVAIVGESKVETAYVLNFDFYKLVR